MSTELKIGEPRAHENAIRPLLTVIDVVYTAAMDIYKQNRKTDKGYLDASSFFRYTKLHIQFKEPWFAKVNAERKKRFESRLQNFIDKVEAEL